MVDRLVERTAADSEAKEGGWEVVDWFVEFS